jgi:hypothetical protein
LSIALFSVKPVLIMKSLSRKFKRVVLVAIGVAAVFAFRVFAQTPEPTEPPASKATFVLKIKKPTEVKDKARFEQVLKNLRSQLYDIDMVDEHGNHKSIVPGGPSPTAEINTDKVTASEVARNISTDELTFIQVRTTRQVASMSVSDIQAVLNELQ